MTARCPTTRLTRAERLPSLEADANRLYRLVAALGGPSCRCEIDLQKTARLLSMRPISFRLALLALRMSGRVAVRRRRGRRERLVVRVFERGAGR